MICNSCHPYRIESANEIWHYRSYAFVVCAEAKTHSVYSARADAFTSVGIQRTVHEVIGEPLILQWVEGTKLVTVFCEVQFTLHCISERHGGGDFIKTG